MADDLDGVIRDDENQVTAFATGGKNELAMLKTAFKDSWGELRTAIKQAMQRGVVAFRGLQVADNQVGEARYTHWCESHCREFLQVLNQLPESRLFGGAVVADNRLVQNFMWILDRLLVDLMLLTAKVSRKNLVQERVDSEAQRLARSLSQLGVDFGIEWEKKYENLLTHNLDTLVLALVYQLWTESIRWLVVLFVSHKVVVEQNEIHSTPFRDTPVPDNDKPVGRCANYYFARGGDPDSLWQQILSDTCTELDPLLFRPSEEFTSMATSPALVCYFRIVAHPNAVVGATFDHLHTLSGLLALLRPVNETEWRRKFATLPSDDAEYTYHFTDPSSACGLAMPIPGTHPFFVGMPVAPELLEACGIQTITAEQLLVPVTKSEVERLAKLFTKISMLDSVVASLTASVTPLSLRRLRKAFRFWSKAERARVAMAEANFSVWSLGELFLDYCMAMEIILGEKGETVQILSSRAATLLADSPDDRFKAFTDVKALYGKRSQYVHEGNVATRLSDVLQMRDVVRQCILYNLLWSAGVAEVNVAVFLTEKPEGDAGFRQGIYMENLADELDSKACRRSDELWERILSDVGLFTKHCDRLRFGVPRIRFDDELWRQRIVEEIAAAKET